MTAVTIDTALRRTPAPRPGGLPDTPVEDLVAGDVVHTHPAAPAYEVASKRLEHGSWIVLGCDGVPRYYAAAAVIWRSRATGGVAA